MSEVLRNIGYALDKFFSDLGQVSRGARPLDVIDHGDPDAGRTYLHSLTATTSTFNKQKRTIETYDILTQIAPPEFWMEIEANAVEDFAD